MVFSAHLVHLDPKEALDNLESKAQGYIIKIFHFRTSWKIVLMCSLRNYVRVKVVVHLMCYPLVSLRTYHKC